MAQKQRRTRAEQARHFLQGGGVLREDSDDELGTEDLPWEWIYGPNKAIIGARMGDFECHIGDTVLLKAAGNEAWVAIVQDFAEGEIEDDDGEMINDMKASFLWFSSEKEIVNKSKKRHDFLENELYITTGLDENSLKTINGKATVLSEEGFNARFPTGKIPKNSKDYGKIFICRRGCNTRTTTYTDEFIWEDVYRGAEDLQSLCELVDSQTVRTRKRKSTVRATTPGDLDEFVIPDNEDGETATPRKRRKLTSATPTSRSKHPAPRKLTTPTHRRIIAKRPLEFTPLGTRMLSPSHTTASPHQLARSTLHVSAVPNALPCREDEFGEVYAHLETAISAGTGSCIYISGTPGTGKTATVREVVAALNVAVSADELDDFVFVEINGMKVTDPHQSYSLLWEALKGQRVSATHALELLEREFSTPSPRRVPCVVLMDELDQLVTKSQGVMYNFFNWPQLRHSRLIVLAVANTMDLPERTLSNKISSRLGLTRITFPGYTHQQLIKIIESRLEGIGQVVVEPDAVQFASRKVAAVSGDARRALDICRRAVEIAESDKAAADQAASEQPTETNDDETATVPAKAAAAKKGVVTISTIKRAINEATSTPLASYLRSLPLASKLFLAALLGRIRRTGLTESTLGDIIDEAARMAALSSLIPLHDILLAPDTFQPIPALPGISTPGKRGRAAGKKEGKVARIRGMGSAAEELAEAGIVGLEVRRGERVGRVRLGVGEEEIRGALREDEECRGLGFNG
ncbi:P-loop containing nucleoside triphosphate hydrolase protein [Aureobasidium pullulans]|uniref:Origin recognition complex subunit 1 n=1 Tax=Aureobasidium pullulans TaxID=5580 RepID=A0A4S9CNV3_AURPU|nr:P-loop containing nucleoside triphosphate hydrolase protein [Aureobasidium pullulans]